MDESGSSLRERALAAWQERQQEMGVEAEKRRLERSLRLVTSGTHAVLRAIGAPESADPPHGINAGEVFLGETGGGSVTFTVEGISLRWAWIDGVGRLELETDCPRCEGIVLSGYNITNPTALGQALADSERAFHDCPKPEPVWEGMLTVSGDPFGGDPAITLLDALQGYIDSVVRAAVEAQGFRNDDEVIPMAVTPEGDF